MKKLTKIWGIGLVIVLVTSLLLSAAPVAASELAWGTEGIPSATDNIIVNGVKIQDFAVSGDGQTIYAAVGTTAVYKSTNGGKTWSTKTANLAVTRIAVAPDDPNLVVGSTATQVDVSTNGGTGWTSLGTVQDAAGTAVGAITDIAVSPADGSNHYIGVAGVETVAANANDANVWYYKLGATGAAWLELNTKLGFGSGTGAVAPLDTCLALAFSPNFASDKMLLAVTFEVDRAVILTDVTYLEAYSFNNSLWNQDAAFTSYPVTIESDTDITACNAGSISLSPDYLGSDDAMRIAFVGLDFTAIDASNNDGIYRLNDTSVKAVKENVDVFSIAYDGTNLVAGQLSANAVYRCADPLASSPTVSTASSLKRLLGTNVVVAWNGADIVAATRGTFSGFGVSRDNGASFNGLSMMDYSGTVNTLDMDVSADGSTIYLVTGDGANAYALWRKASDWEMVFAKAATPTMPIVRVAPDDADSVYLAEDITVASQTIYYSSAGGDTKWFMRTAKAAITEMAVESSGILYTSNGANVYRSTNNGFTWGDAKSAGVDNVFQMKSLGEDTLIAGGSAGKVAYSTDGGQTWSKPHATKYPFTAGNVFVTATGADNGDFIYCASAVTAQNIVRWELGSSTSWSDIITGTVGGTAEVATGIELSSVGALYVLVNDPAVQTGFYRSLSPSTAGSTTTWSTQYVATTVAFTTAPDALILTSGSTKLWAIDAVNEAVYSYEDTVAATGPTLSGPADGDVVDVNPVSGGTFNVPFTWARLSNATVYDFEAALDSGFVEKISTPTVTNSNAIAFTNVAANTFMPGETYYWRVRLASNGPIYSPWSATRSFTVAELPEAQAPVIIQQPPAPVISVPPTPEIVVQMPEIILPAPTPAPQIVIPAAPAPAPAVPSWAIYAIIIIGAVLVIALIVLIMRTRRPV